MTVAIVALLAAFVGAVTGWMLAEREFRSRDACPCGHHPVMHRTGGICMVKTCACQVDYHEALRLAGIVNPHRDAES